MTPRDIPNAISVLRITLVVPIVIFLLLEDFATALILFFIAGISDALDGYLAKRYDWTSRLGSILDPIADKLLLVCSYIALGWLGLIPGWLVAVVIGRDVIILLGACAYYVFIGRYEMAPSFISKLNTVSQIVLALVVVMAEVFVPIAPDMLDIIIYSVLATTILSGIDYVWTWSVRALGARRRASSK